jgi:hypothetical protein
VVLLYYSRVVGSVCPTLGSTCYGGRPGGLGRDRDSEEDLIEGSIESHAGEYHAEEIAGIQSIYAE